MSKWLMVRVYTDEHFDVPEALLIELNEPYRKWLDTRMEQARLLRIENSMFNCVTYRDWYPTALKKVPDEIMDELHEFDCLVLEESPGMSKVKVARLQYCLAKFWSRGDFSWIICEKHASYELGTPAIGKEDLEDSDDTRSS